MAERKESAIVGRTREIAEAVQDVRAVIERHLPVIRDEADVRGYQTYPKRLRALHLGLSLCVHAPTGDSLAKRLKVVPAEYIDRAPDGKTTVRCLCGAEHERAELVECPGGCNRWFVGDDSGVWAVRLPEGDDA